MDNAAKFVELIMVLCQLRLLGLIIIEFSLITKWCQLLKTKKH
jgi:hypothetical protein